MAATFVDTLYDIIQAKRATGYTFHGTPVYDVTKSDVKSLEDTANYFGLNPQWLANLINNESAGTFNPAVKNPTSSATGLIQFMESTGAKSVGKTTAELAAMDFQEQMQYVKKYIYNVYKQKGLVNSDGSIVKDKISQIDLFMMIFYPVAVGDENFPFPAAVVAANGGIKTPKDYEAGALRSAPFKTIMAFSEAQTTFVKKHWIAIGLISLGTVAILTTTIILIANRHK